jgi:hypothetical protein
VGRVGDEPVQGLEGVLQPVQGDVEHLREAPELVVRILHRQAPLEVVDGDAIRLGGHAVERQQPAPREQMSTDHQQGHRDRQRRRDDDPQILQGVGIPLVHGEEPQHPEGGRPGHLDPHGEGAQPQGGRDVEHAHGAIAHGAAGRPGQVGRAGLGERPDPAHQQPLVVPDFEPRRFRPGCHPLRQQVAVPVQTAVAGNPEPGVQLREILAQGVVEGPGDAAGDKRVDS